MNISFPRTAWALLLPLCIVSCSGRIKNSGTSTLFSGHRAYVNVFLSPDCPLCQGYGSLLSQLDSAYAVHDISFRAVFPGNGVSRETVDDFLKEYRFSMQYFIDSSRVITNYFSAETTPQVFFSDSLGRPLYSGMIDNLAYETGKKRTTATEHYLRDALEAFVNGTLIKVRKTEPVGCYIEKE